MKSHFVGLWTSVVQTNNSVHVYDVLSETK